eukprot:scaffold2428_cov412-Prasinococcus_capsulatus_cf.AAC.13
MTLLEQLHVAARRSPARRAVTTLSRPYTSKAKLPLFGKASWRMAQRMPPLLRQVQLWLEQCGRYRGWGFGQCQPRCPSSRPHCHQCRRCAGSAASAPQRRSHFAPASPGTCRLRHALRCAWRAAGCCLSRRYCARLPGSAQHKPLCPLHLPCFPMSPVCASKPGGWQGLDGNQRPGPASQPSACSSPTPSAESSPRPAEA